MGLPAFVAVRGKTSPKNSRIEPLNRRQSIAVILPRRGNRFSLSSEERAGVRTGFLFFFTLFGVYGEVRHIQKYSQPVLKGEGIICLRASGTGRAACRTGIAARFV